VPALGWPAGGARSLAGLVGFVVLGLAVGALGGMVTATSVGTWYQDLAKPPFNPPDRVFAQVWTTLFVLMAVAAWRVWRQGGFVRARAEMAAYFGQLALNLLWSALFFGFRAPGWAFFEIFVLLAAIVVTAVLFGCRDRPAGWLFLPYGAWVAFAAVLNGAICWLN
jgi:tryptophan-rich sensory protein